MLLGLGDRKGKIAQGYDADLTVFHLPDEGPLDIVGVVRNGRLVHGNDRTL
jgi:imidazolonepropionase-like amidohydrolase